MQYLQWTFWIVGLGLQYMVVAALLGGAWREYRTTFFYSCLLVVATLADIVMNAAVGKHTWPYIYYYWTAEVLRQTGLYAVVVSLVSHAIPSSRSDRLRNALIRLLIVLAVIFWLGSFYILEVPKFSLWMSRVIRNLSFCSSIANLALWFVLIAAEKKETRLLMITGGLGLQMTGDAIGQSLRQVSRNTTWPGDMVLVLTHFLCLYIWWQAFQQKPEVAGDPVRSSPEPGLEVSPQPIPGVKHH